MKLDNKFLSCIVYRFVKAGCQVFLAAFVCGCAVTQYSRNFDDILKEANRNIETPYGYRCTSGAHRGASEEYIENTMQALKAADADDRYAFIEFDVQYSADKKIIVFHDKRAFRLFGSLSSVENTTYDDLRKITGNSISSYYEVMDTIKKRVNIEIKSRGNYEEDTRLVDEIMADVFRRNLEKKVVLSSISEDVVRYINKYYPEVATGRVVWLSSSTYLHLDVFTENLYAEMNEIGADYLMLHTANLRNINNLLRLKPKGKTIIFWDFDDTMYIVHKDLSDRVWGDSFIRHFWKGFIYRLSSLFSH